MYEAVTCAIRSRNSFSEMVVVEERVVCARYSFLSAGRLALTKALTLALALVLALAISGASPK